MEAYSADSLFIPPMVPYLGHPEKYFLGSGIAGGGGDPDGIWDYLIGPGYTFYGYIKSCESFISREEIKLVINGAEACLPIEMHRAQGTGIFYGTTDIDGLNVCLIDFTTSSEPWVSRLLIIDNNSEKKSCDVSVRAYVTPGGVSDSTVADTAVTIAHGCNIPDTNKNATITFTDPSTSIVKDESTYILETSTVHILPGQRYVTALYHYTYIDEMTPEKCIEYIRAKRASTIADDLCKCISRWADWLKEGDQPVNIPDRMVRDIVEGAIIIIKMLQGDDGGLMATPRSYMDSYVRDAAGAFSGLIATGHVKEAERFMLWTQHKYDITGMIPCNANIGDDAYYFPGYGDEENWAAETPALYLIIARDYYRKMKEKGRGSEALNFLGRVESSLKYAMDVQLCSLIKNGWKLYFNGDETECGGSGIRLADNGVKKERVLCWSMPSLALCGASLDFFIDLLTDEGAEPSNYTIGITGRSVNLYEIMEGIKRSMDDNFWRTDIPELPGGFYDWYRTREGGWPHLRITNFSIFPLFYETPLNHPERAVESAAAMKIYFNEKEGYMPIQPGGLNEDYCGHNLGYLLYALVKAGDPMMHKAFNALTQGVSMGCWGTWAEAYKADGSHYMMRNADGSFRTVNMRPFETGINIAAILKYVEYNKDKTLEE